MDIVKMKEVFGFARFLSVLSLTFINLITINYIYLFLGLSMFTV